MDKTIEKLIEEYTQELELMWDCIDGHDTQLKLAKKEEEVNLSVVHDIDVTLNRFFVRAECLKRFIETLEQLQITSEELQT